MSGGYNSNVSGGGPLINTEDVISIDAAKQSSLITTTPNRNKLALINQNLLVVKDFRCKALAVPQAYGGNHVFNFPMPKNMPTSPMSGILHSNLGQTFSYSIDDDGKVYLVGQFNNINDELLLNIKPYIVKTPVEYFPNQPA